MRSISFVNAPAVAPVTVLGWFVGSGTKGIRLFALKLAPMRWNSMPVFPYWFDSHT